MLGGFLKKPHIFPYADYGEEDDEDEDDEDEGEGAVPQDELSMPNPEHPIYGFSDAPIIFDFDKRCVFSKSPIVIISSKGIDFSKVAFPKDTVFYGRDDYYHYIKERVRVLTPSSRTDFMKPFSGSVYKGVAEVFRGEVNYEEPMILS